LAADANGGYHMMHEHDAYIPAAERVQLNRGIKRWRWR
jgi:hypothetical protein